MLFISRLQTVYIFFLQKKCDFNITFLRATAVPAGTAEARISYGISVRPSVRHDPVVYQAQVR